MSLRRIALVCSGLEETRDGVGDYSRKLASILGGMGIACALLALNDSFAEHEGKGASGDEGAGLPLLRLSGNSPRSARLAEAAAFLAEFNPDWVSLQFVSYGFNRKGIVIPELWWLPRLLTPYRLELMLHETWVGEAAQQTLKSIIVGAIQRETTRALIARLHPAVVHTTNVRHAGKLASIGVGTKLLPLFSNIPVTTSNGDSWIMPALRAQGLPDIAADRNRYWLFGMFGTLVSKWKFEKIFSRLADIAGRADRIPVVIAFGGIGAKPEEIIGKWKSAFPTLHFAWLGTRPASAISEIMNAIDFAISSHENYAIGKSGSAAAFIEHGVPVITSWGRDEKFPSVVETPFDQLVWHDDATLKHRLLHPPARVHTLDRAQQVARRFLADLQTT